MAEEGSTRARGPPGIGAIGFLVVLAAFGCSGVGFAVALALGLDVGVALAVNVAAAGLLVAWLAGDRLDDPASGVDSLPGAVGTALLVLAGYGLVAALVVGATAGWHGRPGLMWALLAGAVVTGVLGVASFPLELLADRS